MSLAKLFAAVCFWDCRCLGLLWRFVGPWRFGAIAMSHVGSGVRSGLGWAPGPHGRAAAAPVRRERVQQLARPFPSSCGGVVAIAPSRSLADRRQKAPRASRHHGKKERPRWPTRDGTSDAGPDARWLARPHCLSICCQPCAVEQRVEPGLPGRRRRRRDSRQCQCWVCWRAVILPVLAPLPRSTTAHAARHTTHPRSTSEPVPALRLRDFQLGRIAWQLASRCVECCCLPVPATSLFVPYLLLASPPTCGQPSRNSCRDASIANLPCIEARPASPNGARCPPNPPNPARQPARRLQELQEPAPRFNLASSRLASGPPAPEIPLPPGRPTANLHFRVTSATNTARHRKLLFSSRSSLSNFIVPRSVLTTHSLSH